MLLDSVLLRRPCNMTNLGNKLAREGARKLSERLPKGWRLTDSKLPKDHQVDLACTLKSPDGISQKLFVEAKSSLDPKEVASLIAADRSVDLKGQLLVTSPYLSPSVRKRLQDAGIGFVDLTGNAYLVVSRPGLFIETEGANENPDREARPARSLAGAKAARIVRLLIDTQKPVGVREVAARTRVDPGYVSRVFAYLDSETLITRVGRGRLEGVDWEALLRKWALASPLNARGTITTYLDPRGLSAMVGRLAKSSEKYVLSGTLAASHLAPIAASRLGMVWVDDADRAAARLGLKLVDSGANVLIIESRDDGVFAGASRKNDVWYAAPSQVAADLLTSPGRGPAEAEELIQWMREHEEVWRG
ncbi:MAG: hypothetical protein ABI488_17915 [Polyangiaceae bacterium]